jgi:D-3-phosphoglycerate dehydrogenase
MSAKVLISDALSPAAVSIFKDRGLEVDFQPNLGKDKEKLAEAINGFDGLAIRSATKVTAKMLERAQKSAAPASASTMSISRRRRRAASS